MRGHYQNYLLQLTQKLNTKTTRTNYMQVERKVHYKPSTVTINHVTTQTLPHGRQLCIN